MSRLRYATLVLITTALMGSSFSIGKIGLRDVSPLLLVGIRFTLAGALMALFVRRRPRPKTPRQWSRIGIIGLFQTTGVMAAIFISLRTITASESSILTFTNPLLVVILATVFVHARYRSIQWIGVFLGFFGVFVTLGLHLQLRLGTGLGLLGALSWAIATLLVKRWGPSLDTWTLTAYQMLAGGIALLIMSVLLENPRFIWAWQSVGIILWLAIMASIVQFAVWFYLLQQGDPGKTSAFLFLAPFFGVLSGWALLGEPLTRNTLLGGLLIGASIVLVQWPTHATAPAQKDANRIPNQPL